MSFDPPKLSVEGDSSYEYATPGDIADVVKKTVAAFSSRGDEFYSEELTSHPTAPTYLIEGVPYDATTTPSLSPYDTCTITVAANGDSEFSSWVLFDFLTSLQSPDGEKTIERLVTLNGDGSTTDSSYDVTPTQEKAQSWKDYLAMTLEERKMFTREQIAKIALRDSIDEFEGLPNEPQGITNGELEDMRKLIPIPL